MLLVILTGDNVLTPENVQKVYDLSVQRVSSPSVHLCACTYLICTSEHHLFYTIIYFIIGYTFFVVNIDIFYAIRI